MWSLAREIDSEPVRATVVAIAARPPAGIEIVNEMIAGLMELVEDVRIVLVGLLEK